MKETFGPEQGKYWVGASILFFKRSHCQWRIEERWNSWHSGPKYNFFLRAFPQEFSASCPTPARPCMISFRLLFPNVVAVGLFCVYVGVGGGTTRKTRVGPGKLLKDVSATLTSCSSRNLEHVESAAIWCATDDGHTWTRCGSNSLNATRLFCRHATVTVTPIHPHLITSLGTDSNTRHRRVLSLFFSLRSVLLFTPSCHN